MYNARVHVLYVVKNQTLPTLGSTVDGTDGILALKRDHHEERLKRFVARWLPDQAKVICRARFGRPHKEIVEHTSQEEIDLIVIATHGRTGLNHLVMGSVAEEVMRLSPVPVLAVKPRRLSNLLEIECSEGEAIAETKTYEHNH